MSGFIEACFAGIGVMSVLLYLLGTLAQRAVRRAYICAACHVRMTSNDPHVLAMFRETHEASLAHQERASKP